MITDITYPDEFSFTGNPMKVEIKGDALEEVILKIIIENQDIIDLSLVLFGSQNNYAGSVDIANIITSFFKAYSSPGGYPIMRLDDFEINYSLVITDKVNNVIGEYEGKAFRGGLSNKNYALLNSWGLNLFRHRLTSSQRQFLFTTRTNSRHVVMRETEMFPFVFIHPGEPIKFVTSSGKMLTPPVFPKNTLCTLDVRAIRKAIFGTYYEMPSYLVVVVNDLSIFDITLIENKLSTESYLLRFKNSLGAYEQIEVTGNAMDTTTYSEEKTWMSYQKYGFLEEKRSRVNSRNGIIVHTGYKSKEELNHLKDLVKSEEIYFIDPNDKIETLHKCLVTPQELKVPRNLTEPQSIELSIRFVSDDLYDSTELLIEYPTDYVFLNITAPGRPQVSGEGFLYDDDFSLYSE